MSYVEDEEVAIALAARLGTTPDQMDEAGPQWRILVAENNQNAYDLMRAKLSARGYPPSAIDGWPARRTYNLLYAICLILRAGVVNKVIEPAIIDQNCKVEEWLDSVLLTDGSGNPIEPSIGYGFDVGMTEAGMLNDCLLEKIRPLADDFCCGEDPP